MIHFEYILNFVQDDAIESVSCVFNSITVSME